MTRTQSRNGRSSNMADQESRIGSDKGLASDTPGGHVHASVVPGLENTPGDDTIPTPIPDMRPDPTELKNVPDAGGESAMAEPGPGRPTSGAGSADDHGTMAGVGVVREGETGGQSMGMEDAGAQHRRTTQPLSDQGPPTGTE
jgi:hypothetical protein